MGGIIEPNYPVEVEQVAGRVAHRGNEKGNDRNPPQAENLHLSGIAKSILTPNAMQLDRCFKVACSLDLDLFPA